LNSQVFVKYLPVKYFHQVFVTTLSLGWFWFASDSPERLVAEMAYNVLTGTLNLTHSLIHSLIHSLCL